MVGSRSHAPFPNHKVSVLVECFKLVGYNICYLHTKIKFSPNLWEILFPSTRIIFQSTLFHFDHKNIYIFTYIFTHLIQHLFPGHPHPKEGAGARRDQGGIKMSEKLSVQLRETNVETDHHNMV